MNEMPIHTTQMNPTDSMLNQRNQTQKNTHHILLHFCDDRNQQLLEVGSGSCWLQRGERGLSGVVEMLFSCLEWLLHRYIHLSKLPKCKLKISILLNVHYTSMKWFLLKSVIRKKEVWVSFLHCISFTDKFFSPHFTFS